MNRSFHFLPEAASAAADRFDLLFLTLLLLTGFVALAVAVLIVSISIHYRNGSAAAAPQGPASGRRLKRARTLMPLLVFIVVFIWAAYHYVNLARPPPNATSVFVVAKQWMWTLEHSNGKSEIGELHLPLGQPVQLVMTSQDVIHSFFVPAFRIKRDVLPGRYTTIWFTPTQLGEFHLFCGEYCGSHHTDMQGRIVVMPPAEFARWLQSSTSQSGIAAHGLDLFHRHGCSGCHATGSPDLRRLLGCTVHLQNGRTIVIDDTYLRNSVPLPKKDVVTGYGPVMPPFAGQISEDELIAIIEYIHSTGGSNVDPCR